MSSTCALHQRRLIIHSISIATTAIFVAVTVCGKTDTPVVAPAPVVVAEPELTELHQIKRYMQVDNTRPGKPVVAVMLSNTQATDAALKHLEGLTDIKVLGINNTRITDAGLVHLKNLTSLKQLYLQNNQVSDSGLEHLKGLTKLWSLNLGDTQVTDAGLDHLEGLTEFRFLNLYDTKVTDRGVNKLRRLLPKCDIQVLKPNSLIDNIDNRAE